MIELVQQGSDDWFKLRAGKFTGSRFVDLTARNKKTGAKLKSFNDAVWDVVVERMTGQPQDGVNSYSLQWGKDVEPFALEAYELATGNFVTKASFIEHPQFSFAGCSPDGLIDEDGGLELKCPKDSAIHLARWIDGVPEEYVPQVQGSMWVTGREWWDFASYDPRTRPKLRLMKVRVYRDEPFIKLIESSVLEAEEMAQEIMAKLDDIENMRIAA